MAHTSRDKQKLLQRTRRIRGQVEALEKLLEREHDCSAVLQLIAACRGAINALMAAVLEGHVREHVLAPDSKPTPEQRQAAEEVIELVNRYLK